MIDVFSQAIFFSLPTLRGKIKMINVLSLNTPKYDLTIMTSKAYFFILRL